MDISRPLNARLHALCTFWTGLLLYSMTQDASAIQAPKISTGIVIAQDGEVWVTRPGAQLSLTEGFVLQAGDTVWAKMGGSCRGFTPEGETFALNGPGQLVLASTTTRRDGAGISGWIAQVVSQWVGESRRRPLTTRSARSWEIVQEACAPIAPAQEGRVRAASAGFFWTTVPGVDRYEITIAPVTGAELNHTVRGHSLVLTDLRPGEEYVWRVSPLVEGTDMGGRWIAFQVMRPEEEASLGKALENKSDLDAGVLLLSAGLHEEAVNRLDVAVHGGADRRSALRWRAEALSAMGQHAAAYSDILETMARP